MFHRDIFSTYLDEILFLLAKRAACIFLLGALMGALLGGRSIQMQANTKCHLNIFQKHFWRWIGQKSLKQICVRLKALVNRSFRFVQFLPTRLCKFLRTIRKESILCISRSGSGPWESLQYGPVGQISQALYQD